MSLCNYMPHTILATLVDEDEIQGDITKSNFAFKHFSLSELYFTNGSGNTYPMEPFKPDYQATGTWMREWLSLLSPNGVPGLAVKSDFGKQVRTRIFVHKNLLIMLECLFLVALL